MDPINLFGKSFPRANRRSNFLRRGRPPLNVMAEKKKGLVYHFAEREREKSREIGASDTLIYLIELDVEQRSTGIEIADFASLIQ